MESVVNRIIDIDRMADIKINDARKRSDDILLNSEKECKNLRNNINSAAENRISKVEEINKSDYDLKVTGLKKKYGLEKQNMDDFFESRHIEIENRIFAEIVGE